MGENVRFESGIRELSTAVAVVERRRRIVSDGLESGRWSYEFCVSAHELAERAGLPSTDDAWERFLDELEPAMQAAVALALMDPCEESSRGA